MRKPNYAWLLQNWQLVITKLCEECSTHDVLELFCRHVEDVADELDAAGISSKNARQAGGKLREALALLDPEPKI